MNIEKVRDLLKKEEGNKLEFKESFNKNVLKTISAFANSNGGLIILGIDNEKKIRGIELNDQSYQKISNKIIDSLGIMPDVEAIPLEDERHVLIIEVKKSAIPISFEGRYFKRIGNTTREMNFEELKDFFRKDMRWERLTSEKFSEDELDEKEIKDFLELAKSTGRLTGFTGSEPLSEILEKLGLLENGNITNGCMLLFGKNPQQYFDFAKVRVIKQKNNITIIGDRWITGNLFNQFRQTLEAIRNFLNIRYEIVGIERKDIWEYPLEAIREAVANALLHRDYFKPVNLQIKIFEDYIWFYNVGGLSENWDVKKLINVHSSNPRNPIMFNIFYLAGFVESVGSGIERMIYSLRTANLPEPEFEVSHSEFTLYFRKDFFNEEDLRKLGLNDRQIKAALYVKKVGKITNREYQRITGVKKRQASEDLKIIEEKGIFEKKGTTGKGTYYILKGVKGALKGH